MVAINLPVFYGMVPSVDKRLLADQNAQYAEGTWLYSGALDALPEKDSVHTLADPNARIAFRIPLNDDDPSYIYDGEWVEFDDSDTDFIKAPVSDDSFKRYYWTSPSQVPMYNTKARIIAGDPPWLLGIPQPGDLNVVVSGGVSATLISRAYIATLVTEYGEEGPASDPFVVDSAKIDALFTITIPAVDADDMGVDRNITKIRLYRTIVSSAGTVTYYLAVELDAKTTTQTIIDPYTNLVLQSETFDNASWTKLNTTVTANAIANPSGVLTADKLVETAVNATHTITSAAIAIASGAVVTSSIFVKAAERSTLQLRINGAGGTANVGVDLTAGTVTAPSVSGPFSAAEASIEELSSGWYRVNLTATTTGIVSVTMAVILGAIGADTYLGVLTNGLYIFGAQVTTNPLPQTYVATVAAVATYTLSDAVLSSNPILESTMWVGPGTLNGFVVMPNGILAGYRGNELVFSEPYRPHAWPAAYGLSLEFDIMGLGVVGSTLVICTKGNPMTASGVHPSVITTNKIAAFEPCTSKGSIVPTEEGCYYISPNGLILVNAGFAQNITKQYISKDKWSEYVERAKVNAGRFGTAYFAYLASVSGSFDDAFQQDMVQLDDGEGGMSGFMLDPSNNNIGFCHLTDDTIVKSIVNDAFSSEMMLIRGSQVQWLDFRPGYTRDTYIWKSKQFQTTEIKNFTAFKMWFDPSGTVPALAQNFDINQAFDPATQYGVVRIYADDEVIAAYEFRTPGELFRLPSGFKASFWEIEIEARVRVTKFQMATSVKELQVA
jgi:hypothetical protein